MYDDDDDDHGDDDHGDDSGGYDGYDDAYLFPYSSGVGPQR